MLYVLIALALMLFLIRNDIKRGIKRNRSHKRKGRDRDAS